MIDHVDCPFAVRLMTLRYNHCLTPSLSLLPYMVHDIFTSFPNKITLYLKNIALCMVINTLQWFTVLIYSVDNQHFSLYIYSMVTIQVSHYI